jgi:hypothetical protein
MRPAPLARERPDGWSTAAATASEASVEGMDTDGPPSGRAGVILQKHRSGRLKKC